MAFKLTPEAAARVDKYRTWLEERRAVAANLDDSNLAATVKLYMSNMTPMAYAPGEPVYDATMWHVLLPELLRRLEARK